ncbi:uncharacterized protein LOC144871684 isoform X2 [Branchiostoma floridae x Branchiostoma japonicum]
MEDKECRDRGYFLVKTIATGKFGDIKLATAEDSLRLSFKMRLLVLGFYGTPKHMQVAVKIYNKGKPNYELFKREADMLRELKHCNVMSVYDFFNTIDRTYLVMEYCGMNGRLGEFIQQYRAGRGVGLAEKVVRHFTHQLVGGMKYVHKCGIVHRDLTVDNVLVGDRGRLRITGFYYATKLENGCELVSRNEPNFLEDRTKSGLEYTPPEILCQEEYLGKPADVWGMGVMFYMMVSGEKPFIAPQHRFPLVRVDLYAKELSERRPKFNCMISKEAKRLAGELLELDPAKRPTLRQVGCGVFSWTYFVLDPNQVVYIALAHKRKYEKLRRAGKGETVAGDQGETDPEPLFIHRTYDFMEETPAPLRSTPELVHRKYSDKCEALIINHRTKPRDAEANVNTSTRKVQDDASHADSDRSGNVDADLSVRKRRGRDASHAESDRPGNVDADLSVRKRRDRDASHADRSGNVDADLSARKRRGRDASHADRSGKVDADLSVRKRRGRDASHAESDRPGNVDADLSARKRRGRDASHADQSGNVDADLSDRKRRDRDASHADRSGNVDAGLSVHKRRGRDASHGDQSGNVDADLSDRKRRDRDASHADRSGNVDADLSARKRRGRRFIPMTQKDVENLMERNTFALKPPSERKCVEADEVAPPSDHHPSSQMTKTQKDVGDLGAGFVPKPPPGKKSAGVVAPPSGQRPSSGAQIRKRERMESVSKRENDGDLTSANKTSRFRARVPSPSLTPPPECLTQEEPEEGVLKLADGGPRLKRSTKSVQKVPANRTSRFKARIPSPCLTPPPECLTQVEPEEDGELTYLGGGGPTMKLSPDGRKLIPMTQKDVGNLGTGPVPKPPPGKKSVGVVAPPSGQLQSSRAQIRKRERRVPQMESGAKREKGGELPANKTSRFRARIPSPCLTPPPECLVEPEDSHLTYLGGGGPSMKQSPDGRKLLPMTQKDVGNVEGTDLVPKPPRGKKSAGVAAPPPGQRPSSRAHIRKRERMESVSKREKEGELTANKTSCFRARVPSPGLTPPPECLDQVEPEEDGEPSYLEGSGLSVKLLSNGRKRIPMTKKDVGGIGPVPKPPHGKKSAGVAAPQSGQLQSSRAQIRKRESRVPQESVSKSEEDGKLTAKTVWRFKARSPSPCLTPPPECLDLDPKEDERKTAPMTQKSIDSLIDATTFTPKPPPRKKSTAAGMVARPSGQHQSSRASRVQITLKHRRVISPVGRTETVKFKDGFRLAHVAAFRWRSETLSPCLTPPPECLVQEEPALGVLGDNGPGLKRSTPMRSQRHPDVGPREEERGDGEDGSERRSNIRGTKSRSDRDMKRTSRKSEGDVRSAMKRTEANVGQRKDESSTRKRGKSRSQRHHQDGAEADVAGGHALRKTSGRVLLPPVDAKQKKRLDDRARLPPINRRS